MHVSGLPPGEFRIDCTASTHSVRSGSRYAPRGSHDGPEAAERGSGTGGHEPRARARAARTALAGDREEPRAHPYSKAVMVLPRTLQIFQEWGPRACVPRPHRVPRPPARARPRAAQPPGGRLPRARRRVRGRRRSDRAARRDRARAVRRMQSIGPDRSAPRPRAAGPRTTRPRTSGTSSAPLSLRHDCSAVRSSLKTMAGPAVREPGPLVRRRTVAKRGLDRVGRAQMLPVFGREVEEGQQSVLVLGFWGALTRRLAAAAPSSAGPFARCKLSALLWRSVPTCRRRLRA
jgi:hypothetical protein